MNKLFILPLLAVLGVLVLYPSAALIYASFRSEPFGVPGVVLTIKNFITVYGSADTWTVILDSVEYSVGVMAITAVVAYLLSWLAARTNAPLRRLLVFSILFATGIPVLVSAMAWVMLLNPSNGLLNLVFSSVIPGMRFNVNTLPGMMFVQSLAEIPLAFIILYGALSIANPEIEEAARVSGASVRTILLRITPSVLRPAILAVCTLVFVDALSSFAVPLIIGSPAGTTVMTVLIYREAVTTFPPQNQLAATYSISLLAFSLTMAYVYRRFTRRRGRFVTVTGRGARESKLDLGRWKFAGTVFIVAYFLIAIFSPMFVLVYSSFLPYYTVPSQEALKLFSLGSYTTILNNPIFTSSVFNSSVLALGGGLVATAFATIVAYVVIRTRAPGRGIVDAISYLPWGYPEMVLGVGILWAFVTTPLYGTLWILLLAYTIKYFQIGVRNISSSLIQINPNLEEAARTSGAGPFQTFLRVVIPLLRNSFSGAWLILALYFIRELAMTLFLFVPSTETMAIFLLNVWDNGIFSQVAVVGLFLTVISIALTAVSVKFGGFGARR